ncbi:hypothetical protein ACJRO7_007708 [Eucalyptus globulus]|uniref:Late embryogenesis abundant protein LEA-2 subgroup domain-containing protein n=1 Tax=Eucalyptus globulus TaxID=34317 RepID=A0ABD3IMR2_EUCGL
MGYPSTIGFLHPYHKPLPPPQPSPDPTWRFAGLGFARSMLAVLVMFAVLLCTINIIFNVVMRPKPPVFTVDSLSVSDFNVLGSVLMVNWETSVAVDNPDSRLEVRFDEIRCFLCYGDPQYYLAWTTREPFSVGTKGRGKIYLRMATGRRRGGRCKIWALNLKKKGGKERPEPMVVEDIGWDRHSGTVSFALVLELRSTFRYGSWGRRHARLRVSCEDLVAILGGALGW